MKIFEVKEPVFGTRTIFIVGCSAKEAAEYLENKQLVQADIDPDSCGTVLTFRKLMIRVVWLQRWNIPELTHELFHLTTGILQFKQIPIVAHHPNGTLGDETGAYLIEFFMTECLRKYKGKPDPKITRELWGR